MIPNEVLTSYDFDIDKVNIEPFGSGLINNTWKFTTDQSAYILQRINEAVFKQPPDIDFNISLVAEHLKIHHPEYFFVAPLRTPKGQRMVKTDEGYFRIFPFVAGSHSLDVLETPEQAYEAAEQFGTFTKLLEGVDVSKLKMTIPRFHDLSLRYDQFLKATKEGNKQRIKESQPVISKLESHSALVDIFKKIPDDPAWHRRVTHHDTKISNVLFNRDDKGICVIDLDTVMPGYFISDVGDMMRTYLSPVSEEEKDFDKIQVRDAFYHAIVSGYYNQMKAELTETEKKHFFYAGKFMIYMQALRFLTDHLNDDVYYGAAYPGHNFIRANNQLVLLERLAEKEKTLGDYLP